MKINKLILLLFPFVTSCSNTITTSEMVFLTYSDLVNKEIITLDCSSFDDMIGKKESFLMTIYPEPTTCLCWSKFRKILNQYISTNNIPVYAFPHNLVSSDANMTTSGKYLARSDSPTFYIISHGEVSSVYDFDENTIFSSYNTFENEISSKCYKSHMYKVDKSILDNKLTSKDSYLLYFYRSSCSDCTYATPNIIVPYLESHAVSKDMYLFDLDPYYSSSSYQDMKDSYKLSSKYNDKLGYGTGVVPTLMYYENKTLTSQAVIFNDEVTKDGSNYKVTSSYYSKERLSNIDYTTSVIEGTILKSTDLVEYEGTYYWKNSSAKKYYEPIIDSFLDKYMK